MKQLILKTETNEETGYLKTMIRKTMSGSLKAFAHRAI